MGHVPDKADSLQRCPAEFSKVPNVIGLDDGRIQEVVQPN